VAYRIFWSFVLLVIIVTVARQWKAIRAHAAPKPFAWLAVAGAILTLNWGTYVWAVANDQIVAASLGYFINPLVSVALGVLVLKEHLNATQWMAVGLGVVGVLVMAGTTGAIPWIGLILAFTFGTYGLIKKKVRFGAIESLTIETAAMTIPAIGVLIFAQQASSAALMRGDVGLALLIIGLGPVTTFPLLAFGAAAMRLPLSSLGLLQYICPIMIFLTGVIIYSEPMTTGKWIAFALIWLALVVFSLDAIRGSRRGRMSRTLEELEVTEPA
jgi:chloramphenicol-sensitive protein RarD